MRVLSTHRLSPIGPGLLLILSMTILGTMAPPAAMGATAPNIQRLAGSDRYDTAAAISRARFSPGVGTAFVATGGSFPDALSAAPAAARGRGPILLTAGNELPAATATELGRLKPSRIVVLGGPRAVSANVLDKLRRYSGNVTRWSGADRYATAAVVSARSFNRGVAVAYVATGTSFPDALAGGAVAARVGGPILLTSAKTIPSTTRAELSRLRPGRIVVLGGTAVISETVRLGLQQYTTGTVSRLAGGDRYATSVRISRSAYASSDSVVIATGTSFPDGLAGGPVAALLPGPLLLVSPTHLPTAVRAELQRLAPSRVYVLGGTRAVSASVVEYAKQALAPSTAAAPISAVPASAPKAVTVGVWISSADLLRQPMSGAAWTSVVNAANIETTAAVGDQDSRHDQETLAAAIYAARTGLKRDRAMAALQSAIGTERGGRWLAVGRNLLSYVVAADLLGIRSGPVYDWLASFRTMRLAHNTSGEPVTFRESAWNSGSNASSQEGAAYVALAVYLRDADMLAWSWNAFRRYAGDRTSPHAIRSNSDAWQQVPSDPVGIQNAGATANGCSIDGAVSNDMSRGGEDVCSPVYTQYPWVGLEGAVPAAMILERAGYPAWGVANKALRRAAVYLMSLRNATGDANWYDGDRSPEIKHLLNRVYGLGYPGNYPVGAGRIIGYTDYTHP